MIKAIQLVALLFFVAFSYGCTIQLAPLPAGSTVGTTASANGGDTTDILRGTGSWNAGWWLPYKYISYAFAQTVELSDITLVVDQNPSGFSRHQIIDSQNNVLHTFEGNTVKGQVLTFTFPSGTFTNSLTIRTTQSNSNTAWLSITINAQCPACNVQLAPITPTGLVQTTITTNSGDANGLLYGTGSWNGGWWGDYPLKYVQYNFDTTYELVSISLVVDQNPNGPTTHQISGSNGLLHTFSGNTVKGQVLFFQFPAGTLTSSLKVLTTSSVSNAAWTSITIVANKPTCPLQVAPIPSWSPIPTTITTNSGDAVPLLRGTGSWNGGWWGDLPLKYVQYNLGAVVELDSIVLVVDQQPAGNTQHQLIDSLGNIVHTFTGYTERGTVLSYKFPTGTWTSSLRILTTSSVSNAAWLDVTILRKQ